MDWPDPKGVGQSIEAAINTAREVTPYVVARPICGTIGGELPDISELDAGSWVYVIADVGQIRYSWPSAMRHQGSGNVVRRPI